MDPAPDESGLVSSCQAGRLEDFDPLYRHYVKPIYGFILRRTLVREIAEDLTSTTFLKALENIGAFSPKRGAFAAWLYGIARNSVTDHYRSRREYANIEDVWDLAGDDDVPADASNALEIRRIREALSTLDRTKRDIVLMRVWDGLSYKEIAAITGKSEGNCKVIVSRTLGDLRSKLPLALFLLLLLPPLRP